ncbi:hypothetical protein SCHPADRAFT_941345 [Schizopora paradoxa]|uniref:DUF6534 domain-containing protein n=1 Tax=Schizopora paradoxa TaxID=27342 RepID=A0A0H2RKU1_9AGAM|nr:hypothetical protein SCHPADRAFT_941345 [Schizopora paradoxa]
MSTATGLPALDNTMGALFIGCLLTMGLWGAESIQLYYYFEKYPKDNWWIKSLVIWVWCLDTTHQALTCHGTYTYLVSQYGNPAYLNNILPSLKGMAFISAFIWVSVQSFLVLRIYRLCRKDITGDGWKTIPLVGILVVFVAALFICLTTYSIKVFGLTVWSDIGKVNGLSRATNAVGAAADVSIAMALVFLLHRARSGYRRTQAIINRLITFTINTSLLTSISSILSLITISLYPHNFIYITFFLMTSRLYVTALFATLNARRISGDVVEPPSNNTIGMAGIANLRSPGGLERGTHSFLATQRAPTVSVKVETETYLRHDENMKHSANSSAYSDSGSIEALPYIGKSEHMAYEEV